MNVAYLGAFTDGPLFLRRRWRMHPDNPSNYSHSPNHVPANQPPDGEFRRLVDCHYEPLRRFALGLANNAAQAADLTQQTFYLWAVHGHQLRERGKAKCWLYTTLYREFLREHRRHGRFQQLTAHEEISAPAALPPDHGAAALDGALAMRTIENLPETLRAPLLLFYAEGLSYLEITAALGIPIGTVMSRLSRGREELRARLLKPPCRVPAVSPARRFSSKLVPA